MSTEMRCPSCRKLLGIRLGAWAVEARNGRRVTALIERGALVCEPCGEAVRVEVELVQRVGLDKVSNM